MSSNLTFGFGIYLPDFEIREDALERLYDAVPEKKQKKIVRKWKKKAPSLSLEQYLTVSLRVNGIESVLADMINEDIFGKHKIVAGSNGALYAPLHFPRCQADIWHMPMEEEIRSAITEYARICYKGVYKKDVIYGVF